MDIVLVEWNDAQEETGVLSRSAVKQQGCILGLTVGFLVEKTGDNIKVSSTCFDYNNVGEHFRSTWTIPMGCVKKIRKLGKV